MSAEGVLKLLLLRYVHSFEFHGDEFSIRVMRAGAEGRMTLIRHSGEQVLKTGAAMILVDGPGGLHWAPWPHEEDDSDDYCDVMLLDLDACALALRIAEGLEDPQELPDKHPGLQSKARHWRLTALTEILGPPGSRRLHLLAESSNYNTTYCSREGVGRPMWSGEGVPMIQHTLAKSPLSLCEVCERGWMDHHGVSLAPTIVISQPSSETGPLQAIEATK